MTANSIPSMGDFLYSRLPRVYVQEDQNQNNLPLKRFLQVFGVGLDAAMKDVVNYSELFNPDKCPDQYLPNLAAGVGIQFPYDMTPQEQRRFIKAAPTLYKLKGTIPAFEYLARELTGQQFTTTVVENRFRVLTTNNLKTRTFGLNQNFGSPSSSVAYTYGPTYNKRTFQLIFTAQQDTQNLNDTYNRISAIAQYFSPAGSVLLTSVVYYFSDVYDTSRIAESVSVDNVTEATTDAYSKTPADAVETDLINERLAETRVKTHFTETALTNDVRFRTNRNFYTNAGSSYDTITDLNTGKKTIMFT